MQLLTDDTRIRRRKRVLHFPTSSKSRDVDLVKLLLLLLLLMPIVFLLLLVHKTTGHDEVVFQKPHLVSPEALRSRDKRIKHLRRPRPGMKGEEPESFSSRQVRGSSVDDQNGLRRQINPQGVPENDSSLQLPMTLPPIHNHTIPNNLFFTHSINLLTTDRVAGENVALKQNVLHTIDLHPTAKVHFWTDLDCLESIARAMGPSSPLMDFFQRESHGMYKADICRGAALYEYGGLYMDVDLAVKLSAWSVLEHNTTFGVPLVHKDSKHPGNFFQAFIASTPQNPILKRYLELFIDHYEGRIDLQGPLGVLLLRKAHDAILGTPRHPKPGHDQSVQYFQEVLYDKALFPHLINPPTYGTRRACHFVVVSSIQPPFVVPFYSRVEGSRMCGGVDSDNKGQRRT